MIQPTRLIQRCKKTNGKITMNPYYNPFGIGLKNGGFSDVAYNMIQQVLQFEYMCRAEFEWGAVPNSFKEIYEY